MGSLPLFLAPMPIKRSILDSSIVDFVPRRTAHRSCMKGSAWFCKAIKPSSVFAKANVGLPVVGLSFIGTTTLSSSSSSANCLLLANFLRTLSSSSHLSFAFRPDNKSSFSCLTSSSLSINKASSTCNCGCVNILMVKSISFNSPGG